METLPLHYSSTRVGVAAQSILDKVQSRLNYFEYEFLWGQEDVCPCVIYGLILDFKGKPTEFKNAIETFVKDDYASEYGAQDLTSLLEIFNSDGKITQASPQLSFLMEYMAFWLQGWAPEPHSLSIVLKVLQAAYPYEGIIYRGGVLRRASFQPLSYTKSLEVAKNYAGLTDTLKDKPHYPKVRSGQVHTLKQGMYTGFDIHSFLKDASKFSEIASKLFDEYGWEQEVVTLPDPRFFV